MPEWPEGLETLDPSTQPWDRVFTLAPLVLVGTREANGDDDLAPKHMAMPAGLHGHFVFACTPRHATWRNALRSEAFTVSYPRPGQILSSSLAAAPRCGDGKPALGAVPTFRARTVDAPLLRDAYLHLECRLDRVVDDLGDGGLLVGRIVAAHAASDVLRGADVDDADLLAGSPLLAYLHPGRWSRVQDSGAFPFHEGFAR